MLFIAVIALVIAVIALLQLVIAFYNIYLLWKAITGDKLMKFLGIVCYMGLVTYPKISDDWSKKKDLQKCSYSMATLRDTN